MNEQDRFEMALRFEEKMYGAVGTSDCHKVGISGGCGLECWVYLDGRCEVHDEMVSQIETEEEKQEYEELYGGEQDAG